MQCVGLQSICSFIAQHTPTLQYCGLYWTGLFQIAMVAKVQLLWQLNGKDIEEIISGNALFLVPVLQWQILSQRDYGELLFLILLQARCFLLLDQITTAPMSCN